IPSRTEPSRSSVVAAKNLGRILWRIDDLTDLVDDFERGVPNALCWRIAERLARGNRAYAGDADLYDEIDATVVEILQLLTPGAFGLNDSENWNDATSELLRLAWTAVAGWAGWHEENPNYLHKGPASDWADALYAPSKAAAIRLVAFQRDGFRE